MKLDYGKNYTYQLFYFNDVGSVNITNWHYSIQNFPKLIDKPQCTTKTSKEMSLSFSDPSNFQIIFSILNIFVIILFYPFDFLSYLSFSEW